jgi:hypothetical protein
VVTLPEIRTSEQRSVASQIRAFLRTCLSKSRNCP